MTKKARKTYRNCLRFLFRRGPCVWINACQIAMMISFLLFIAGSLLIFFMAKFQHQKLVDEDAQYAKLKNQISFAHCDYNSMEKEFNTQFCSDRSREYAFAWRYFKTNSTNETCFDIHEQVDCHTYLIQNEISNFERPKMFFMCGGLLNIPIKGWLNETQRNQDVKGPQILDLSQYLNKTLHSSEIFVKCPICEFSGSQFHYPRKEEKCYQKIETLQTGWPAIAESCDKLVELGPQYGNCSSES